MNDQAAAGYEDNALVLFLTSARPYAMIMHLNCHISRVFRETGR